MKNLLFAALLLFAACSKDDEASRPVNTPQPELIVHVYSNHKYPLLKVYDDTTITVDINNGLNRNTVPQPVKYTRQVVNPGDYIFFGIANNNAVENDTNLLDANPLWVRLVVIAKGDTITDSTSFALTNPRLAQAAVEKTIN